MAKPKPEPATELVRTSASTIKKYGLSVDDWEAIADRQGRVCGVCRKLPASGRLCIDHEHVKGWKKMPPEQRKLFVRGLLCYRDNSCFLAKGITIERSQGVTQYLVDYRNRSQEVSS